MGIENALTAADIQDADGLIIASEVQIQGRDRFEGIPRVVVVPTQLAIKDPAAIFELFKS